jgi:hypothetical protein
MQMIGSTDVDYINARIVYQIFERLISAFYAECAGIFRRALRRTPEHSLDCDSLAPQRFQMRPTHKPQSYDGRAKTVQRATSQES